MSTAAYTLIRSKRKTLTLIVQHDGTLLARAPLRLARAKIDAFVAEKAAWIRARQEAIRVARSAAASKQYVNGEEFLFLGQACKLEIVVPPRTAGSATPPTRTAGSATPPIRTARPSTPPTRTARSATAPLKNVGPSATAPARGQGGKLVLVLEGGKFRLAGAARLNVAAGEKLFTAWYKQQARWVLAERVEWFASRFKFTFTQVRISSARTRWGSCSNRGSLSFTWRLVMAPLEVVDYVVVHELAHLRIKNHSPAFWKKVESILPDYKARQKWLKTNGGLLALS
jgi:predicted metal-dependent hydrolase